MNEVAEIASSFEDFENLREKKISKDISGLNFDFEAPPSFDAPDLRYVGIYKPEWLSTDAFGVCSRDDEASRSDVAHCCSLPVNMLAMAASRSPMKLKGSTRRSKRSGLLHARQSATTHRRTCARAISSSRTCSKRCRERESTRSRERNTNREGTDIWS